MGVVIHQPFLIYGVAAVGVRIFIFAFRADAYNPGLPVLFELRFLPV